jgi:hypothetical protein
MVLFTIVEAMRVLNPPLRPIFEQLTPGSQETPYLVPLSLVYDAAIALLGSYALANIALGLAQARRYEDPSGARVVTAVMVVAVSLVAVGGIVSVSQLPLDEIPMTPTVIAYLVRAAQRGVRRRVGLCRRRGHPWCAGYEKPVSGLAGRDRSGLIITAYAVRSAHQWPRPRPRPSNCSRTSVRVVDHDRDRLPGHARRALPGAAGAR